MHRTRKVRPHYRRYHLNNLVTAGVSAFPSMPSAAVHVNRYDDMSWTSSREPLMTIPSISLLQPVQTTANPVHVFPSISEALHIPQDYTKGQFNDLNASTSGDVKAVAVEQSAVLADSFVPISATAHIIQSIDEYLEQQENRPLMENILPIKSEEARLKESETVTLRDKNESMDLPLTSISVLGSSKKISRLILEQSRSLKDASNESQDQSSTPSTNKSAKCRSLTPKSQRKLSPWRNRHILPYNPLLDEHINVKVCDTPITKVSSIEKASEEPTSNEPVATLSPVQDRVYDVVENAFLDDDTCMNCRSSLGGSRRSSSVSEHQVKLIPDEAMNDSHNNNPIVAIALTEIESNERESLLYTNGTPIRPPGQSASHNMTRLTDQDMSAEELTPEIRKTLRFSSPSRNDEPYQQENIPLVSREVAPSRSWNISILSGLLIVLSIVAAVLSPLGRDLIPTIVNRSIHIQQEYNLHMPRDIPMDQPSGFNMDSFIDGILSGQEDTDRLAEIVANDINESEQTYNLQYIYSQETARLSSSANVYGPLHYPSSLVPGRYCISDWTRYRIRRLMDFLDASQLFPSISAPLEESNTSLVPVARVETEV